MQVNLRTPVRLRLLRTGVFCLVRVKKSMRVLLGICDPFVLSNLMIPPFYYVIAWFLNLFFYSASPEAISKMALVLKRMTDGRRQVNFLQA
ncbi:MAG: hypothetical protein H6569_10075 [Lewinellaceae bacterium]|nr:hypothetical protein [Lewinellaceae bacterium]